MVRPSGGLVEDLIPGYVRCVITSHRCGYIDGDNVMTRLIIMRGGSRDPTAIPLRPTLAALLQSALGRCPPHASLEDHGCRKIGEEREPQGCSEQTGHEAGNPRDTAECTDGRTGGQDEASAARSGDLCGIGIVADPGEGPHGHPVSLDPSGLVVVMPPEPHRDQDGGPEGNDRHIDQSRHINER